MKYYYDLHIHSCLSPCADILMTPNNILNMAYLKGLDIIAITDHNSTLQLNSIMELAKSYNFIVIPGVEIETKEHYHVVCLFKDQISINKFQAIIDNNLTKTLYDSSILGEEIIMDINDEITSKLDYNLLVATNFTIKELVKSVKELSGITILAHPYKYKKQFENEIINLFDGVESSIYDDETYIKKFNKQFHSSDAHQIIDILEKTSFVELEELSIKAIFEYMEK